MTNELVMRRYAVPGAIVKEWIIRPKEYSAFTIRRGQTLRFVDIEGKQVPDLVCFNERDLTEHLNMGNSLLLNKRRELRKGDMLYSVICNPMLTITGYSNEESYAYGPMCSEELNRIRYGVPGTRNCRDNFAMALAPYGFNPRQIPNAFVPFMRGGGRTRRFDGDQRTDKSPRRFLRSQGRDGPAGGGLQLPTG